MGLEEQRTATRDLLVTALSSETHGRCDLTSCTSRNPSMFVGEICRVLGCEVWPPPCSTTSIRSVLEKLPTAMEIQVVRKFRCKHTPPKTLGHAKLLDLCKTVKERMYGICSKCAREEKWQSKCTHVEQLRKDAAKNVV